MIVPAKAFEEDDWEDPSMSGWMTLYCVWILLAVVMGAADIWQLPYTSVWMKSIGYFSCLLPIYSLVGVMLRFRNAVALSIMSLFIFICNNIASLISWVAGGADGWNVAVVVAVLAVNTCWIAYFFRSHLVAVRFPKQYRRVYAFDWILFVLSAVISLMLIFSVLGNCGNYRRSSTDYKETLELSERLRGMHDYGIGYVDCKINDPYCILYFTEIERDMSRGRFDSIVSQPYFSDMLLFDVNKASPEFVKSAIGDGLILVFNVFFNTVNDGHVFKIDSSQIANIKETEPIPDLTPEEMEEIRKQVEDLIPSPEIGHVRLKSSEWLNEIVLEVDFEVDESNASFAGVYDAFKAYADEVNGMLMKNTAAYPLAELWRRQMSVKFVLTGSKTRYSKDIMVF